MQTAVPADFVSPTASHAEAPASAYEGTRWGGDAAAETEKQRFPSRPTCKSRN